MCGQGVKKLEGIAEFCAHPSACKGEGMSGLELGEGCMLGGKSFPGLTSLWESHCLGVG